MCKSQLEITFIIKDHIEVFKELSDDTPNDCSLGTLFRCLILDEIDKNK